jgi:transglutaminase-like putative cysteine protease
MRFVSPLLTLTLLLAASLPIRGQAPAPRVENAYRATFVMSHKIVPGLGSEQLRFDVLIPKTIPGRQDITAIKYSAEPVKTYERDGCSYAQFEFKAPKKPIQLVVTVSAELHRYDLSVAQAKKDRRLVEKDADMKPWLAQEKYLEKDDKEIQAVAKKLAGKTELETVRRTVAYVARTLRYGAFDGKDNGALWALRKKLGDCTEFTDLFVALCRANNIPTRFREGLIVEAAVNGSFQHDWAEVYLPTLGWVPFDPCHVRTGTAKTDRLRPIYLYLDTHRQNETLQNGHYWAYRFWGESAKVEAEYKVTGKAPFNPR